MAAAGGQEVVELIMRNPSHHDGNFAVEFPFNGTIAELQQLLSKTYHGHPTPSEQVLVYAGKVLKDVQATIREVTGKTASEAPFHFHLIVRKGGAAGNSGAGAGPSTRAPHAVPTTSLAQASAAGASSSSRGTTGLVNAPAPPPPQPAPGTTLSTPTAAGGPSASRPNPAPAAPSSAAAGSSHLAAATAAALAGATGAAHAGPGPMAGPVASTQLAHPYQFYNPTIAAAYQAAYTAALAALTSNNPAALAAKEQAQAGAGQPAAGGNAPAALVPIYMPLEHAMPPPPPFGVAPIGNQEYLRFIAPGGLGADMHEGAAGPHGVTLAQMMRALEQTDPAILNNQLNQMDRAQQGLLRRRFRAPRGNQDEQQQQPGGRQGAGVAARLRAAVENVAQRRQARVAVRINMRGLLQVLVFFVVMYQHFTLNRFLALVIGGAVLYATANWVPLRRLVHGLHAHPHHQHHHQHRRRQAAAPAGAAAVAGAGAAAPGQAAAPAPGAGGDGAAAGQPNEVVPAQPAGPPRRSILHELIVFVVGFITSLLPAWNFNHEDAAIFAAAQQEMAADERARQRAAAAAAAAAAAGPPQDAGADAPAAAADGAEQGEEQGQHVHQA